MEKQLTGYPSIDKPWLKYFSKEALTTPLPECTIYSYLWENNKDHLSDIALIYFNRKISYKQLFSQINHTEKAFLREGVKAGDIVVLATVALPETVFALYALSKIGAIADIIDPRLSASDMKACIIETNAKLFFCIDAALPNAIKAIPGTLVKNVIGMSPADSLPFLLKAGYKIKSRVAKDKHIISWKEFLNVASVEQEQYQPQISSNMPTLMTHTSGTTGKSKGVLLSHNNINGLAFQYSLGMDHERGQRYMNVIPPFIAFGVCVAIHLPLSMGMVCILIPKFEVDKFYDYLKAYKPNHFTCTPSNMDNLSKDLRPIDLSYFRVPSVGGDYISSIQEERINNYLKRHNCPVELVKGYGMTEVSSSACTTMKDCNKKESIGVPLCKMVISVFKPGTEEELPYNQQGELCFSGPNVMLGYYNNIEATSNILKVHSDGRKWIHSGDIGYMDEDGFVYVLDRLKRMIHLSNGYDLLPSIVEHVIIELPQVEACAVVGYTDEDGKTQVKAYVVLTGTSTEKEILDYCKNRLSPEIIPQSIVFIDKLPLTPVGKIDYRALEEEIKK